MGRIVKDEKTGCWNWPGAKNPDGYGSIGRSLGGKPLNISTHRLSYEMHKGPIPRRIDGPTQVRQSGMLQSGPSVSGRQYGQRTRPGPEGSPCEAARRKASRRQVDDGTSQNPSHPLRRWPEPTLHLRAFQNQSSERAGSGRAEETGLTHAPLRPTAGPQDGDGGLPHGRHQLRRRPELDAAG